MGKTKKLPQRMLRLIVDEHNRGIGYRKISSKYNIHVSTIKTTIQRWKRYGVVTSLPRKGRPRKRDERAERLITRKIMQSHIQREQNFKGICRRLTPTLTKVQLVGVPPSSRNTFSFSAKDPSPEDQARPCSSKICP